MGLWKYFGEQDDQAHSGHLFWSGHLEAPFRGRQAPLLKRSEYEQLDINYDAKVATFDLSNEAELRAYREILDRSANGWYIIHHVSRHWDEEKGAMKVYVEWLQKYTDLPPHLRNQGAMP